MPMNYMSNQIDYLVTTVLLAPAFRENIQGQIEIFTKNVTSFCIESLQSLSGFHNEHFVFQNQVLLTGISLKKMNVLHWIIFINRKDILMHVLQKYFESESVNDIGLDIFRPRNGGGNAQEPEDFSPLKRTDGTIKSQIYLQTCIKGEEDSYYDVEVLKEF